MKVAVLTNAYPPRDVGGASRIAAQQVEMLRAAGHEVRVWAPEVPWFRESPFARFFHHLRDLVPNRSLANDILAWRPDVLLTHNLTGCGFGTPSLVKASGVRWVHMLHDIQLFEPSGLLFSLRPVTFWQLFWAALRSMYFGRPSLVISPTLWLVEQHRWRSLLKDNQVHSEVLPNPGPEESPSLRTELHKPLARLLFVGHVSQAKGSRLLEEIVDTLRIPFELHIIGEGPDLARLAKRSPQVIVHGVQGTAEVLACMKEMDVLLVPSLIHENQPTVILEAASVGLPVIASHRGGIIETLDIAAARMVCDPKHVEAWCHAIERLEDSKVYAHQSHLMRHIAEAHEPAKYAQRFIYLLASKTR